MKPIFIASVMPYVGKNVVCVGLANRLSKMGKKVGYFKPFSRLTMSYEGRSVDSDAAFFKKALRLDEKLEDICPMVIDDEIAADILRGVDVRARDKILEAFKRVSKGKDAVLCLGMGSVHTGLVAGYSAATLADEIDAPVLLVDRYAYGLESVNGILGTREILGDRLVGTVFNRVQDADISQVQNAVTPFLEDKGVKVFGVLPDDGLLGAVPVRVIAEELQGRILCGGDHSEDLVQGFSIGAMRVQAALRYLRHTAGRAVITGGDRHDIQLAALEAGAKCLVLTGDLYPNERILTRAEECGTPVILVNQDTAATVSKCESLGHQLGLNSLVKADRASQVCEEHIDFDKLLKAIGIKE